jgi:hypothetical protein
MSISSERKPEVIVIAGNSGRRQETVGRFPEHGGSRWRNTGNAVEQDALDGCVCFGRRDRTVKRRGNRSKDQTDCRSELANPDWADSRDERW